MRRSPQRENREATRPSVRVFQSDRLEWLSCSGPKPVLMFWLPFSALALGAGLAWGLTVWRLLGCTVIATVAWSLFEYSIHRFGFHAAPTGARGRRLTFVVHGCHHEDPDDPMRSVIPLSATIPAGIVLYGIVLCILPTAVGAWMVGVFTLNYLFYDVMHWRSHQLRGGTRIEQFLRRNHMIHHYSHERWNFGVSSPVWDILFGTFSARRRP